MEVNRLCLDTCAYTQFRRGHSPVVELVRTRFHDIDEDASSLFAELITELRQA